MAFDPDYRPMRMEIIYAHSTLPMNYDFIAFHDLGKDLGIEISLGVWGEFKVLCACTSQSLPHLEELTQDSILIMHGIHEDMRPYTAALRIAKETPARIIIVYDPVQPGDHFEEIDRRFGIKREDWPLSPKSQISFFPLTGDIDVTIDGLMNGSRRFGEYLRELAGVK